MMIQKKLLENILCFLNTERITAETFRILFQQKLLYYYVEYPELWEPGSLLFKAKVLMKYQNLYQKKINRTNAILSNIFDAIGIQYVTVKGIAFAECYIPRPQERPSSDVDVLIKEMDLPKIIPALISRGFYISTAETTGDLASTIDTYIDRFHVNRNRQRTYYLQHGDAFVCSETGVTVELHVTLLDTQEHVPLNVHHAAVDSLLANAVCTKSGSCILSNEDTLLFCAWHAMKHLLGGQNTVCDSNRSNFIEIRGLSDIAFVLLKGGLDRELLISRAEAYGFLPSLRLAVKYCQELCGHIAGDLIEAIPQPALDSPYTALLMQYEQKVSLVELFYANDRFSLMHKIVSGIPKRENMLHCLPIEESEPQRYEEICDDDGAVYCFTLSHDKNDLYLDIHIPNDRLRVTENGFLRIIPVMALGIYHCGECNNACALNLEFHICRNLQGWSLHKVCDQRKEMEIPRETVRMTTHQCAGSTCFKFHMSKQILGGNLCSNDETLPFDFGISENKFDAEGNQYECFNSWTGNNRIRFRKCYFLGQIGFHYDSC